MSLAIIPKTMIIGGKGFIGSHFCRYFRSLYPDTLATHHTPSDGFAFLDLADPTVPFSLEGYQYALITGGIGNPTECAFDGIKSARINVQGTLELGNFLLKNGVVPVFFSTDYVFDGCESIYRTNSPHSPLNEYGKQKAQLEVEAHNLDALVVRLSKVYGLERGDGTLFDEMAANLVKGQPLRAASDQVFAPICVEDVVRSVVMAMCQGKRGVINIAGRVPASRFQMALKVAEKLKVEKKLIQEISLSNWKSSFSRPKRIVLETEVESIPWEEGIAKIVEQYR